MKRSEVVRAVAELTRELGHPPDIDILAARLGQSAEVMQAAVQALISEKTLFEHPAGRYALKPLESPADEKMPQPGLFDAAAGDGGPAPDGRSEYSQAAISEEKNVQPSADENPGPSPIESRSPPAEPDRKPSEPQPRRQEIIPTRRTGKKAGSATGPFTGQWQIASIRIVMAAAGIGAAIVSGYFMILKLSQVMPSSLAALLGSITVAFSVIAFEVVIVFFQRKQRGIAAIFVIAWLAIWIFTLLACLSGFYSFYSSVLSKQVEVSAPEQVNRRQLDLIHEREAELQTNIAEKRTQIIDLQRLVDQMSATIEDRQKYAQEYADAQARLLAREQTLSRMQDDLQAARNEEGTLLTVAPTIVAEKRGANFYAWLGAVTRLRADTLELLVSLLPALLIDLMAAGGLAIALFLEGERKQ